MSHVGGNVTGGCSLESVETRSVQGRYVQLLKFIIRTYLSYLRFFLTLSGNIEEVQDIDNLTASDVQI